MSQKQNKKKERKFGNVDTNTKKPLIDPRYKNLVYTIAFIVVVLTFFVVNNTQSEPDQGPYPPNFNPENVDKYLAGGSDNFNDDKSGVPTWGMPEYNKNMKELKGKVVLVDFWATWCPPCRVGIPDLVELKNKYGEKNFEVIGVSLDGISRGGATKNDVEPFMKEFGINYPVVHAKEDVAANFQIRAIPTAVLYDKKGNLVETYQGLVDKSVYVSKIDELLK